MLCFERLRMVLNFCMYGKRLLTGIEVVQLLAWHINEPRGLAYLVVVAQLRGFQAR